MACGCAGENTRLISGGKRSRRRQRRKSHRRKSRVGSGSKKKNVMRGGVNMSLLGDQSSNVWNFTSKLLGTPGTPAMPWNQPANYSYRYGNSYVV